MRRWFFILLAWLGAASAIGAAETMPPKPAQYFNDYAGVVSAPTAASLNSDLENFEKQTSNQVVVAIFPKMESDSSLEDYTNRVAASWKVGQAGKNNGVVFFVFVQEHQMRIEVGYGLEGALPDALAKRILDDEVTPHFKSNDYSGGVTAGVTAIEQAIRGEYKGNGTTAAGNPSGFSGLGLNQDTLFLILGLIFIIFKIWYISQYGWFAGTVFNGSGRSTYGGGGFFGGGFSGGGGSFGGGGASGHW